MPKRRKERVTELGPDASVFDRVRWLLSTLWGNNESAMARSLGVSQTTIWRTVSGKRPPGRELLEGLCKHPKVNPTWLTTGVGTPLLASREELHGDRSLPIARQPLSGPPTAFKELLSGETFAVPDAYYGEMRYWLEIQARDPIVAETSEKTAAGDLLLMETDPAFWREPRAVDDRLCVVDMRSDADAQCVPKLGRTAVRPESMEEPACLEVDVFERLVHSDDLERIITIREIAPGKLQAKQRLVRKSSGHPAPQVQSGPHPQPITLEQVIAVCRLLLRR